MDNLGQKIKKRREELGLSQEDLAKILGYKHKSSINKIELGAADVPRAKVPAFAKALGMTAIEFSGWTEDRKTVSFSYCLEQQMKLLGWVVLYDADGNVILTHDGVEYEVTEENIKELESRVALYMDFLLNDLAKNSRKIGG
ncbi:helix-turn-helix domain-containing protein [Provencibacterium massiliense]|jgi:transcriptional regulator with XRE-family HTH domain|uniref:helix-turn-helix domain-containing protein n=1 Tax=Provencibacterium massiliense TaxID=1841868 RepID=UPI0009A6ECCD|nr:helix-turn-helix transcriptional regulator [Provencibacterium massiliense]